VDANTYLARLFDLQSGHLNGEHAACWAVPEVDVLFWLLEDLSQLSDGGDHLLILRLDRY
jgi:hypothetical protein